MELGWRQIDAAAVHVGVPVCQAERLRADDAAIDDIGFPVLEIVGSRREVSAARVPFLNSLRIENSLRRSMASAPSLNRTL